MYLQGSNGDADTENRLVDTVGEGKGVTNKEISTEIYTLPYVKQIAGAGGNLLYDKRSSNLVLCDYLEGWDGEGGERGSIRSRHMYIPIANSC